MCTVSWTHREEGYELFCNRDERDSRMPALAPQVRDANGVRYLAPLDGDFGGTWIASNEWGLTLCLLNGTIDGTSTQPVRNLRSRGQIVLNLVEARRVEQVLAAMQTADLTPFSPFTLVALEPGLPASVLEWCGCRLSIMPNGEALMPLISSSFDAMEVRKTRLLEFRANAGDLRSFHASHNPSPSAYSVCMHRTGASTVSYSSVTVSQGEVLFHYTPGAPCRGLESHTESLRLRA